MGTYGWRIVISPMIPQDSPPCYHSSMRHLVVLFIHFLAALARLLGPGGVRSIVAESLLLKHQLLLLNRPGQRSPPSLRVGPYSCRRAGTVDSTNSSAPFRNCTEAFDTASPSQGLEQAKVPHPVLPESPSEARPEGPEPRTYSCGRRNEAT